MMDTETKVVKGPCSIELISVSINVKRSLLELNLVAPRYIFGIAVDYIIREDLFRIFERRTRRRNKEFMTFLRLLVK